MDLLRLNFYRNFLIAIWKDREYNIKSKFLVTLVLYLFSTAVLNISNKLNSTILKCYAIYMFLSAMIVFLILLSNLYDMAQAVIDDIRREDNFHNHEISIGYVHSNQTRIPIARIIPNQFSNSNVCDDPSTPLLGHDDDDLRDHETSIRYLNTNISRTATRQNIPKPKYIPNVSEDPSSPLLVHDDDAFNSETSIQLVHSDIDRTATPQNIPDSVSITSVSDEPASHLSVHNEVNLQNHETSIPDVHLDIARTLTPQNIANLNSVPNVSDDSSSTVSVHSGDFSSYEFVSMEHCKEE